jgi:hypothetical protein
VASAGRATFLEDEMSEKAKHTEGPWRAELYGCVSGRVRGHWRQVALVTGDADPLMTGAEATAMRDANANLVAAAPELLAALKELVESREKRATALGVPHRADGSDGRYARARAALAKAEPTDA